MHQKIAPNHDVDILKEKFLTWYYKKKILQPLLDEYLPEEQVGFR